MSFCHNLNPYIHATRCHKPLIFKLLLLLDKKVYKFEIAKVHAIRYQIYRNYKLEFLAKICFVSLYMIQSLNFRKILLLF